MGYLLARWRQREEVAAEEQARRLGIGPFAFARLSLCRAPQRGRWEEDMERCARYAGADLAELRRMLLPPAGA
jgi:hypothetical protein